jgi:hypothetical protein
LWVIVYDPDTNALAPATVNGTIDMSGNDGIGQPFWHCGGGAGGTILIEASTIDGTGTLRANGGDGLGGGDGGGGIISLIENQTAYNGILSVSSISGSPGIITFTAPPASGY